MSKYKHDYASTKPGTLAGRYLRMFWQPVHRVEDVKMGQAKPLRVTTSTSPIPRASSTPCCRATSKPALTPRC